MFSLLTQFRKFWGYFDQKVKKSFYIVLIFTIIGSVFELIGIGLLVPYASFLSGENSQRFEAVSSYFSGLNMQLEVAIGIAIFIFFLFRSIILFSSTQLLNSFYNKQAKVIMMDVIKFVMKNNSINPNNLNYEDIRKASVIESREFTSIFDSLISLINEFIILFFLIIALWFLYPFESLVISLFSLPIFILGKFLAKYSKLFGEQREKSTSQCFDQLDSIIKNIRLARLSQSFSKLIMEKFDSSATKLANAHISLGMVHNVPRYLMDFLVYGGITLSLIYVFLYGDKKSIEFIITFVIISLRIFPSSTRIIAGFNNLVFHMAAIPIVEKYDPKKEHLEIIDKINYEVLSRIDFMDLTIRNPSLEIEVNKLSLKAGLSYIVKGESGSGKSTLVDFIMGFILADKGKIFINGDNHSFTEFQNGIKKYISYVPQDTFLFNGSIQKNILAGSEMNIGKYNLCKKIARIDGQKNGLKSDYVINNYGTNLSIGQRQRISIARALYVDLPILILDEPSSALDHELELGIISDVIDYRKRQNMITIVITHSKLIDKFFDISLKIERKNNKSKLVNLNEKK